MARKVGKQLAGFLLVILASCAPRSEATPLAPASPGPAGSTPAAQTAEPLISLKVGVLNYASYAPFYIAKAEGYFEQEGLNVELVSFRGGSNETIPALAKGEIDVLGTTLSPSVFNAINQGVDLKFVADKGFIDPRTCPVGAWVASKQALASGLKAPSDLKGKKVIVESLGDTSSYALRLLLSRSGLTIDDLDQVYIADSAARVEALRTGVLDVAPLGEPWITIAQSTGAGEVWVPFSEVIPGLPLGILAYGPSILDKNPEAGVRFMVAYLRAVEQYIEGKTDRNIQLISEFTKLTPDQVRQMCWSSFKPDGSVDTEAMLALQKWMMDNGQVDKKLELDQFWTDEFLAEAEKRLGK